MTDLGTKTRDGRKLVASAVLDGGLFRHLIALGKPTVTATEIRDASAEQLIAMRDDLSRITEAEQNFALLMSTLAKALFCQLCKEELAEKFPDNVLVELSVTNMEEEYPGGAKR